MKAKPQKEADTIRLKATQPRQIKAALKSWVETSGQMDTDPLNLNDAPPWVDNAWAEVVKVVLPGRRLPTVGEWDLELLGELMGRLQAFAKLYEGEIPMGPEVKMEHDQLQQLMDQQPQSKERAAQEKWFLKDLKTRISATNETIPQLMAAALASSHSDALKFQNGLTRGMSLAPDELATPKTFQRHTRTYFVLATSWRAVMNCRSLRHVHEILCAAVGENRIGNFKTFEKVCGKIGLSLRQPGRPAKPQ